MNRTLHDALRRVPMVRTEFANADLDDLLERVFKDAIAYRKPGDEACTDCAAATVAAGAPRFCGLHTDDLVSSMEYAEFADAIEVDTDD